MILREMIADLFHWGLWFDGHMLMLMCRIRRPPMEKMAKDWKRIEKALEKLKKEG